MAIVNVLTSYSFDQWRQATNSIATTQGDLELLNVGIPQTSIVDAINYVQENGGSGSVVLDSDLMALSDISTTGILVRTGAGTATTRSVVGQLNKIAVSNEGGISGNITISIGPDIVTLTDTQTLDNKNISGSSVWNGSPVGIAYGGTGASSKTAGLLALLPSMTGADNGKALMTTGSSVYWGDAGSGGGSSGTTINIIREQQIATNNQSVFNLAIITYQVGTNQLKVFINGVRQFPDAYTETNSSVVTMSAGLKTGDKILFEVDGVVDMGLAASDVTIVAIAGLSATSVQGALVEIHDKITSNAIVMAIALG